MPHLLLLRLVKKKAGEAGASGLDLFDRTRAMDDLCLVRAAG